ncbi:Glycosyl transferase family 2 [Halogranum amylolyticum]|uniref:Glycosyl transferase family 2 n=1 Tax=Halogranum amylolyticum TaxID=660520 RepID=A0A1H8STZ2_9EURY|nr:glycosyltransferase family A protein [Halogranum amylolyticum]SEO82230.1 Glycosyl transferase family 2 [Halogranum amylolyticum]
MPRYSVAVCSYNMAETVRPSLRSMLEQVGDDFEFVVVDGGSTDGTVERLRELEAEDDRVRVVALDPDPDRRLGADRQRSIEECDGEYVLTQLDVDDVYEPVVEDFVSIYHDLEAGVDREFLLSGTGINMAPKSLYLELPYRNLASSEDRDLWRRLFAADAMLWLEHAQIREQIGYEKSLSDRLRRDWSGKVADAQVGIDFLSCLRWSVSHPRYYILEERRGPLGRVAKSLYDLVTYPLAYYAARELPRFETPPGLERRGTLERLVAEARKSLSELEAEYEVSVDREALSARGRQLFCLDEPPRADG